MTSLKYLRASGLVIKRRAPAHDHTAHYQLSLPATRWAQVPDPPPVAPNRDWRLTLAATTHAWIVAHWERLPGPGEDDFRVALPTRQHALTCIFDFYFGQPTHVREWMVPLHRHPEVRHLPMIDRLHEVPTIRTRDFVRIRERRLQQIYGDRAIFLLTHGKSPWEKAIQAQFLCFRHADDPERRLYFRRDGHEAYIVKDH